VSEKCHITVLCGGQSTEHEISVLSARNVVVALDRKKYEVSVIYITRQGRWYLLKDDEHIHTSELQQLITTKHAEALTIMPGDPKHPWVLGNDTNHRVRTDCVLPILHGTFGEDGTMQGLLEIVNVPYVGAGVVGSALCMEKHIAKSLLRFANLPTADWLCIDQNTRDDFPYAVVSKELGETVFVKPVGLGSSVGISKVRNAKEFDTAIREAFQYDDQVIVEKCITGREIECSVLGNQSPVASLPGEFIVSQHEFYSYEAKYLDPASAEFITPADLPEATVVRIQQLAVEAFKVLQCVGMARVDFFVTEEQEVIINEVNTIPGFTDISMYPKNWKASGLPYSELLDDLIRLALARHDREASLSRVFVTTEDHKRAEEQIPKGLK